MRLLRRHHHALVCHEEWDYDEARRVATVTGFAVACTECNLVLHFGRAEVNGLGFKAKAHRARINGVNAPEVEREVAEALSTWNVRSGLRWTVAIAPAVVERFPFLEGALDVSLWTQ
ncbi:MAG TPA: hypothetical protein VHC63_15285 [Acidimicrobiales bacterium]|nr:hypothetical protein [Acidimicrobiales bacterium]